MSLLILIGLGTVYLAFILKYSLLERFGQETQAPVTSKDDHHFERLEGSGNLSIFKAVLGRHKLFYRYDTKDQKRHFGQARIDDFTANNTKVEDQVPVLYLTRYPHINCLKPLLLIRFRELVIIGSVYAMFFFISLALTLGETAMVNEALENGSSVKSGDCFTRNGIEMCWEEPAEGEESNEE